VTDDTAAIIHLAAVTSVLRSIDDPVHVHMVNVDVTARLLELAREHGVGSFLLASTNAVTGNVGQATISERTVLRPLTPYGATKAAGEMLVSAYTNCYGITGASLRFSNVYGPGMAEKDSFIPASCARPATARASRCAATEPCSATSCTSMTSCGASSSPGAAGTLAR